MDRRLPQEMWLSVFEFVSLVTLRNCPVLCKSLHAVFMSPGGRKKLRTTRSLLISKEGKSLAIDGTVMHGGKGGGELFECCVETPTKGLQGWGFRKDQLVLKVDMNQREPFRQTNLRFGLCEEEGTFVDYFTNTVVADPTRSQIPEMGIQSPQLNVAIGTGTDSDTGNVSHENIQAEDLLHVMDISFTEVNTTANHEYIYLNDDLKREITMFTFSGEKVRTVSYRDHLAPNSNPNNELIWFHCGEHLVVLGEGLGGMLRSDKEVQQEVQTEVQEVQDQTEMERKDQTAKKPQRAYVFSTQLDFLYSFSPWFCGRECRFIKRNKLSFS